MLEVVKAPYCKLSWGRLVLSDYLMIKFMCKGEEKSFEQNLD